MGRLTKDMHKPEIESALEGKGDFVKIDYLTRYLKLMPPIEMRKFAYLKLAQVYIEKGMFIDAAKSFRNAAVNSVSFREKQENFFEEARSYVQAGKFDESDKALRRAMDEANKNEKEIIYTKILEAYKEEALKLEKANKPGGLVSLYEKMLRMKFPEADHEEIKEKLLELYERLGKIKEAKILRDLG